VQIILLESMDINNRFSFRLNKRAVKIDRSFYTSARLFI